MNEKDSLWRRVVRSKYVIMILDGIPLNLVVLGQSLLRFIHKGWGRFYHHFSFEVGAASSMLFWHDCWCQEGPLRDLFASLYVLAVNRDATIAYYYHHGLGAVVWYPVFIRNAFVDDTSMGTFVNKLNPITPKDSFDAVTCDLNSKGVFTVKSYYLKLLS